MPSARPTTAMRPTTPLSPRFDGTSSRYDGFQASRQGAYQPRSPSSSQQRRKYGNNLSLPGLPRFHPANYASSSHSSFANTPASGPSSPHGPASPGVQQKLYTEGQRQLYSYQLGRTPSSQFLERPDSPRLQPLGSPGPVTPLELETHESYLSIGKSPSRATAVDQPEELASKLAQAARQQKAPRVVSNPRTR
ncbi:hypothetical protein KVT40_005315 [Elsinoe batatas]|uniref:Uncharacterized protein n=1 Tax=Elsinoe batatas TaxID=2601811 RepID=A0A8K0PC05_9PEZI|nr:hypothetical protein KVT40_005315 [Elsinoe batatas]